MIILFLSDAALALMNSFRLHRQLRLAAHLTKITSKPSKISSDRKPVNSMIGSSFVKLSSRLMRFCSRSFKRFQLSS